MGLAVELTAGMANKGFRHLSTKDGEMVFEGMGNGKKVTIPLPSGPEPLTPAVEEITSPKILIAQAVAKVASGG